MNSKGGGAVVGRGTWWSRSEAALGLRIRLGEGSVRRIGVEEPRVGRRGNPPSLLAESRKKRLLGERGGGKKPP